MKNTKIVATIGPATESEEVLGQMISAGLNIARFNTKHADPQWHNERIKRVKAVAKKMNQHVGVLVDLQGPEIRINLPEEKPFDVKSGDTVYFTADEKLDQKNRIFVPQVVIDALKKGNEILLDDGACEFTVIENHGTYLETRALVDCNVGHRKTMNTPGVILDMPSLTDRDYNYLDGIDPKNVDFVGLSFVRDGNDIDILKSELEKRKYTADIISKIENQAALDNIEEIIEKSEGIMVARGDLGVEVPYEQLIRWQKMLIDNCRVAAKPVITATQMLKSMVSKPRPTRAEVSDVAHAIYDGTDAVMLSDETTIGEYPVRCVSVQAEISEYNEPFALERMPIVDAGGDSVSESVVNSLVALIEGAEFEINKVICLTETGETARLVARHRPIVPIHAVTSNEMTANKLAMVYGVTAHEIKLTDKDLVDTAFIEKCKKAEIVKTGEVVVVINGTSWQKPGLTNTLRVVTIN